MTDTAAEPTTRACSRCSEVKPLAEFYFVSKKLGTRRGQCKACMSDLKAMQKDPDWRPACSRCDATMDRFGPGRRLCQSCFDEDYDFEATRPNGSHLKALKDCSACGTKRLRADHEFGTQLCAVCRSVPQGRRQRLRLYNLNPREYVALLEAQHYRCPICGVKPRGHWHVDHQHGEPMIVRGVVCGPCNTVLALARDSQDRLRAAAAYIDHPPAQELFPGRTASPGANRVDGWAGRNVPWAK